MKNLFFIVLSLITINSFSQEKKELSPEEFEKLKTGYAKMIESESYHAMRAQSKAIAKNLSGLHLTGVKTEEDFSKWINENFSKTKFSSIDDAKSMFKKMFELTQKMMDEYKDVGELFVKASSEQSKEVMKPEMQKEWDEIVKAKNSR